MVRAGPRVSAGSGRAETGSSRQGQGLARLGNGACSAEGGVTVAAPGTEAGCKCRLDVQAGHVEQSSASRKDRLRRGWSYSIPAGLEKTLESPWDCQEIQSVHLKETSPGRSLEGLMLKMKLQYFGHLIWKKDSLEKTPMLGKIESWRRGRQRMR